LTAEDPVAVEAPAVSSAVSARLEIRLPSGIVINVFGEVTGESLRQVLAALAAA
jgi:hypothetical protein